MATTDRACLTCSCPSLRTYRTSDAYCSACGHPAAQHGAALPKQYVAPIHEEDPAPPGSLGEQEPAPSSLRELQPVPGSIHEEEQAPTLVQDEALESGWRAALPSGLFVSIAIAAAGAGLIIEGLAIRFKDLLAATPWW